MMSYGLSVNTISKIQKLFLEFPELRKALLYGSRAMGNYRNGSDIDLTLVGNISMRDLSKIEWQLDDLMLPYMIDLSRIDDIKNPDLLDHIKRRGKIFYERSNVLQ